MGLLEPKNLPPVGFREPKFEDVGVIDLYDWEPGLLLLKFEMLLFWLLVKLGGAKGNPLADIAWAWYVCI